MRWGLVGTHICVGLIFLLLTPYKNGGLCKFHVYDRQDAVRGREPLTLTHTNDTCATVFWGEKT